MRKNDLIRKPGIILKFMAPKLRKKTVTMHLLPNISRSKGNQTIKFGLFSKNMQKTRQG